MKWVHLRARAQRHRQSWWLILVLLLPMALTGCGESRSSSKPLFTDNGHFMDMLALYTHCIETEDVESMRVDAHVLARAVDVLDSAADPRVAPSVRLSADPAAMAAACALRAGQTAKEQGDHSYAQTMYQLILTHFPQSRYDYYTDQAREGLEQLHAEIRPVRP